MEILQYGIFSTFHTTLILREINFDWFRKVKNCCFYYFGGFEFWFLRKMSCLKMSKSSQKLIFRSAQMVKMAVFWASKWPRLISCKIWSTEKSCNFHIGYSQLGSPCLYSNYKWIYPLNKKCKLHSNLVFFASPVCTQQKSNQRRL